MAMEQEMMKSHKTDFETTLEKSKAIPANDFFDELERRLEQHYESETLTTMDKRDYEQLKRAFLDQSNRFVVDNLNKYI